MERNTLKKQKNLLRWAKGRSKRTGVPFTITLEDIIIPKVCPVLNIPLFCGDGKATSNSPTLDRVVPDIGYVPGNVLVISQRANYLKGNASWKEISMIADYYEEHILENWMRS